MSGGHDLCNFVSYINVSSLCWSSETNILGYVNCHRESNYVRRKGFGCDFQRTKSSICLGEQGDQGLPARCLLLQVELPPTPWVTAPSKEREAPSSLTPTSSLTLLPQDGCCAGSKLPQGEVALSPPPAKCPQRGWQQRLRSCSPSSKTQSSPASKNQAPWPLPTNARTEPSAQVFDSVPPNLSPRW